MSIVSVVGGGWSVSKIDLHRIPGHVIAINDAAVFLPHVHEIVSMDRLWTEYRWKFLEEKQKLTWLRRSAVQNIDPGALVAKWLRVFECDHKSTQFTDEVGILNGTNSGMCGFNRAVQCNPEIIYLFGFDMCAGPKGQVYWYPPYPWSKNSNSKLSRWSREFDRAEHLCTAKGIRVINASSISAIPNFTKTREFELVRS